MAGWMNLSKDLQSVFAFANDVIDFFEPRDVTLRESFLVWDEEI